MPNGTDCGNILQTEARCVPTQWFVLDCTAGGRVAEWLRADVPGEVDYLHAPPDAAAADDPKAALVSLRPTVLHVLLDAHARRRAAGSAGRLVVWAVADLSDPAGNRVLAELPLDIANLMFWHTGLVPAVVRAGVGGTDEDRRRYLSRVRDQYFGLPDFTGPYYGRHAAGQLYGNEFDVTLLCPDDGELRPVVEHLVALHLEETRFARSHLQRGGGGGGIFVIEEAMRNSLRWRRIDWLAVTCYPFVRRLWDGRPADILDLLDYRRCPDRERNPWAALHGRTREKDWDDLGLDPAPLDPAAGEEEYRVTPGDHRTRLPLADFLLRHGLYDDALRQCGRARAEGGYAENGRWVKVEGLGRHGLGDVPEARRLFAENRGRLQADPAPSAQTLDEIGSVALMEGDFGLAYESARRAVERDRFLGHAYDTMVIAGRESGNPAYERAAAELAAANGATVPIHARERTSEALKGAKVTEVGPEHAVRPRPWWRFWR